MKNPSTQLVNKIHKLFSQHRRRFKLKKDLSVCKMILSTNGYSAVVPGKNSIKFYFGNNKFDILKYYPEYGDASFVYDCLESKTYSGSMAYAISKGKTLSNALALLPQHYSTHRGGKWQKLPK